MKFDEPSMDQQELLERLLKGRLGRYSKKEEEKKKKEEPREETNKLEEEVQKKESEEKELSDVVATVQALPVEGDSYMTTMQTEHNPYDLTAQGQQGPFNQNNEPQNVYGQNNAVENPYQSQEPNPKQWNPNVNHNEDSDQSQT
jgi:hypothetical protein